MPSNHEVQKRDESYVTEMCWISDSIPVREIIGYIRIWIPDSQPKRIYITKIPTHHPATPTTESPVLGGREDPTAWAEKVNVAQVASKLYSLSYKVPSLRTCSSICSCLLKP